MTHTTILKPKRTTTRLKDRRFPSIPEPQPTTQSLVLATTALKEAVELLTGQRSDSRGGVSAVTWDDLVNRNIAERPNPQAIQLPSISEETLPSEVSSGTGASGPTGPVGPAGPIGPEGPPGPAGPGLPVGGLVGQFPKKSAVGDYFTTWVNLFPEDISGLGIFATTTDASYLTGTLSADRIADGSLSISQVNDLWAQLASKELLANKSSDGALGLSDILYPTQHAVKTYVDTALAANDAMVFKGTIDASTNPNYPAADAGWTYRITVAGKIGGASGPNVEVGDLIICLVDGSAAGTHAAVGANWAIAQGNIDGAVIGPVAPVTDANPAVWDGVSGRLLKQVTYSTFKSSLGITAGDVSGLATIATSGSASDLIAGTVPDARISGSYTGFAAITMTSPLNMTGWTIPATSVLFRVNPLTADGADNARISLCGGGSATTSRGAQLDLYGNEHAALGGFQLVAGNASTSNLIFGGAAAGTMLLIRNQTSDGADSGMVGISSSGSDADITRGAYVHVYGNEHASSAGNLLLASGSAGTIRLNGNPISAFATSTDLVNASGTLNVARLATASVTWDKLESMNDTRLMGRAVGAGAGQPLAVTPAQAKTLLGITSSDVSGLSAFATSTDLANATGSLATARLTIPMSLAGASVATSGTLNVVANAGSATDYVFGVFKDTPASDANRALGVKRDGTVECWSTFVQRSNRQLNTNSSFVASDIGTLIVHNSSTAHAWTISNDATLDLPIGSEIYLFNGNSGIVTITRAASVQLYFGGTNGDVAFGFGFGMILKKVMANVWVVWKN